MGSIWAATQEELSDFHGVNILEVDNQEESSHHHRQQHEASTAVEVDRLPHNVQVFCSRLSPQCMSMCVLHVCSPCVIDIVIAVSFLGIEFPAEKVSDLSILVVGELPVFPHVEAVSDHVTNKKTRADEGKHARKVFKELIFSLWYWWLHVVWCFESVVFLEIFPPPHLSEAWHSSFSLKMTHSSIAVTYCQGG